MKQFYLILLLLCCCTFSYAQKDFREGYIIQGSDTIRGLVDYRGDARSAQFTIFKSSVNAEEQRFTPNDIAGYGFEKESKAFETKEVKLDGSLGPETQTLFLSVLVKGKASLYYYRNTFDAVYYFLQKDTLFEELVDRTTEKVDPTSGTRYQQRDTRYIGILNYAFLDCQQISIAQLQDLKINHSDLIKIVDKYNKCAAPTEEAKTYTHRKDKAKVTIGPALMLSQTKLNFTGPTPLGNTGFPAKYSLGGGAFINIVLPVMNEKLSLQTELLYVPYQFSGTHETTTSVYVRDYKFDLAYLKLPMQIRYTYPKGSIRPFANAGFIVGYAVKDKNEGSISAGSRTTEGAAIPPEGFNNYTDGFVAGVGLTHLINGKPLSLEIRYEQISGVSKMTTLGSSIRSFNFLLSYGLF